MGKAIELAKFFMNQCIQENYEITVPKLQKLLYYAQGEYIAKFNDSPDEINKILFEEKILAWSCGPAIRELKEYFRGYNINVNVSNEIYWVLSDEEYDVLEYVFQKYGKLESSELTEQCKRETPWINARLGNLDVIELKELYVFFQRQNKDEKFERAV